MTQYAIFVHAHTYSKGKHSGLTFVKYDDNGVVVEVQQLDLIGKENIWGDAGFSCKIYTESSIAKDREIFLFIKNNLTFNQPTTEIDSHTVSNGDDYKRLDVSGDIAEIWDRMVLDAALRASGNPSNYSFISQVCNTYTVYLAESFLGVGKQELFRYLPTNMPFNYFSGFGEFDKWLFSDNKKGETIKSLFKYIRINDVDIPSIKFEDWKSSIFWNLSGGLEINLNGIDYTFYSDSADFDISNDKNDRIILLNGGANILTNSGSNVEILGGSDMDAIVNSGSGVEIFTGDGIDFVKNTGSNAIIDVGYGSDIIFNSGFSATINAGEGSDLIQDNGGGHTIIDLGNDDMTDRVVLRKEEGSVTEIINAGVSDMLVISQGSLQSINQLGDDLKLIIDSFEVYLRGGVSNGPEHLWIGGQRYRRENGTYVLDKQEDGLVAEIVNIGIDMESGSVFGNEMCFKAA